MLPRGHRHQSPGTTGRPSAPGLAGDRRDPASSGPGCQPFDQPYLEPVPGLRLAASLLHAPTRALRVALGEPVSVDGPVATDRIGYRFFLQPPTVSATVTAIEGINDFSDHAGVDTVSVHQVPGAALDWRDGSGNHILAVVGSASGQDAVSGPVGVLTPGVPVYAGLVETARTADRQGLTYGAASLREASSFLRTTLLPAAPVSYTHLRAHETPEHIVCRLLLEKKKFLTSSRGHTTMASVVRNQLSSIALRCVSISALKSYSHIPVLPLILRIF